MRQAARKRVRFIANGDPGVPGERRILFACMEAWEKSGDQWELKALSSTRETEPEPKEAQ